MSAADTRQAFLEHQAQIDRVYFVFGAIALLIIVIIFLALILVKAGKRYDQHVEKYPNLLPKEEDLDRNN